MKLIIDIPDEIYDDIKHGYTCPEYADTLIQLIPSSKPYEERPQGEWVTHITYFECSNCKHCCEYDYAEDIDPVTDLNFNFCPNCGASMVRGEKDGK